MDIKEYINSGKIEEYILGLLSEEEEKEIIQLSETYPEIKTEIEAGQAGLNAYVSTFAQTPPPDLRSSILEELESLDTESKDAPSKNHLEVSVNQENLSKTRANHSSTNWRNLMIAASVALLLSLLGNVLLYQNLQQTRNQLQVALLEKTQFAQKLEVKQTQDNELARELAVLKNPQNQYIQLKGSDAFPEAEVAIYWDKSTKNLLLKVNNLPLPPEGMQYQLWAIYQDAPVDAGVFDLKEGTPRLQTMKSVPGAEMFVITLEKAGGVAAPEGQAYALAEVS